MSDEDTTINWERQEDGSYAASDERASITKGSSHWELEVPSAKFVKNDFDTLTAAQEWYGKAPAPIGPNEIEGSNMSKLIRQRLGRIATALREIDADKFGDVISELESLTTHDGDLTSEEVENYRQTAAAVSTAEVEKIVRDANAVSVRIADRLQNVVNEDESEDRIVSRLYGDAFRLEKLLGDHGPRESDGTESDAEEDSSSESEEIIEASDAEEAEDEESSDLAGVFDA